MKVIKKLIPPFFFVLVSCMPIRADIDHSPFTALLKNYVNTEGQVNYALLKTNRGYVDRYLQSLEAITDDEFNTWSEPSQIAYLINAYNAKTLQVIIDHYPIKANWKAKLLKHPQRPRSRRLERL